MSSRTISRPVLLHSLAYPTPPHFPIFLPDDQTPLHLPLLFQFYLLESHPCHAPKPSPDVPRRDLVERIGERAETLADLRGQTRAGRALPCEWRGGRTRRGRRADHGGFDPGHRVEMKIDQLFLEACSQDISLLLYEHQMARPPTHLGPSPGQPPFLPRPFLPNLPPRVLELARPRRPHPGRLKSGFIRPSPQGLRRGQPLSRIRRICRGHRAWCPGPRSRWRGLRSGIRSSSLQA